MGSLFLSETILKNNAKYRKLVWPFNFSNGQIHIDVQSFVVINNTFSTSFMFVSEISSIIDIFFFGGGDKGVERRSTAQIDPSQG